MKRLLLVITSTMIFFSPSWAEEPASPSNGSQTIRHAIMMFRQQPLSPEGRAAGEMVRRFAEESDTVIINLNSKVVPFANNVKLPPEDRALLVDAFVIGSIDSQLLRNERKDDPYGGVTEVIRIYKRVQQTNPGLTLPEIENFIQLEQKGELKKYVESR